MRTIRRRTSNECWVIGSVALIDVSTKKWPYAIAMINAEDLTSVVDGGGRWYAVQRRIPETPYAVRGIPGQANKELMHRVLIQGLGDLNPDHLNHDGLDNRRSNLRPATFRQNVFNARKRRSASTSRYKGVSWYGPRGKWIAVSYLYGIRKRIGYFDNEEDAARAYDKYVTSVALGEKVYLNFTAEGRLEQTMSE
jgi:hypothetical protein